MKDWWGLDRPAEHGQGWAQIEGQGQGPGGMGRPRQAGHSHGQGTPSDKCLVTTQG